MIYWESESTLIPNLSQNYTPWKTSTISPRRSPSSPLSPRCANTLNRKAGRRNWAHTSSVTSIRSVQHQPNGWRTTTITGRTTASEGCHRPYTPERPFPGRAPERAFRPNDSLNENHLLLTCHKKGEHTCVRAGRRKTSP